MSAADEQPTPGPTDDGTTRRPAPKDAAVTFGEAPAPPKRSPAPLLAAGALVVVGAVAWFALQAGRDGGSEQTPSLAISSATAATGESAEQPAATVIVEPAAPSTLPSSSPVASSSSVASASPSSLPSSAKDPAKPAAKSPSSTATGASHAQTPPKPAAAPAATSKPNRDTLLGGRD